MIWNHSKQFLVNWCCRVKPEFFRALSKIKHKSGNKHCEHLHFYQLCLSLKFVFYFWLRHDGPRTKAFRLSLCDYLRDGPIKNNKKQKQKQHIFKKNFPAFHRWSQKRCLVRGKIPASPKISSPPPPPQPVPIIILKWFIPKLYTWLFCN